MPKDAQSIALHSQPKTPPPERTVKVGRLYTLHQPASSSSVPQVTRTARVLDVRASKLGYPEAYISYPGQDKRLDTWVPISQLGDEASDGLLVPLQPLSPSVLKSPGGSKRRKLDKPLILPPTGPLPANDSATHGSQGPTEGASLPSTPDREHAAATRVRNFEDTRFGEYRIRTWYYSPYPFPLDEQPPVPPSSAGPGLMNGSTPGSVSRSKKQLPNGFTTETGMAPGEKTRAAPVSRSVSDIFAIGVGKGGEGARGRIWVCDLCFKYMRNRVPWERHSSTCTQFLPPGRKVYQRGSYTIWEVDGAEATLYCQNLSLFGKLFIDHKVENFLFYIMCEASTSYRDQPLAFFSKEKLSYDDYNLACIVTFPPFQGQSFGKLLIEFSYFLTRNPSTRPPTLSPGTPERPLSDLGLKGYLAYWSSVILRFLREALSHAPTIPAAPSTPTKSGGGTGAASMSEGRELRRRSSTVGEGKWTKVQHHDVCKHDIPHHKGQYVIAITLSQLARACHLRVDDTAFTLTELGLLDSSSRRDITVPPQANPPPHTKTSVEGEDENVEESGPAMAGDEDEDDIVGEEWKGLEVVVTRDKVEQLCKRWKVRDQPLLDEEYVLL